MNPTKLDHVAYWLDNRDEVADFCVAHLGMHVIDRTDKFTLIGSNARRGKLTLFEAEGPRERGALKHVALRVSSLDAVGLTETEFEIGDVVLKVVEAPTDVEFDLDHVALWSKTPEDTADAYLQLGFEHAGERRVEVGGAYIEFHAGDPAQPDKPLLNHVAVLIDSADAAKEYGAEVESVVDAANTYAVFVWGPERVRIEYVEHKPTFSLV